MVYGNAVLEESAQDASCLENCRNKHELG